MIAASRAYIKAQIQKCNADYKEINDPFGDNDVSLSLIDNNYKLFFGSLSTNIEGNYMTDVVGCTLELYKKAGFDEVGGFDELFDLGINIKNTVLDPLFVKNTEIFTDIIFESITPEPLPSNDKVFKILLTFQIRKDLTY